MSTTSTHRRRIDWTDEEIDYLVDNYRRLTGPQIAKALGKSLQATYLKAFKLGLSKEQPRTIHLSVEQRS